MAQCVTVISERFKVQRFSQGSVKTQKAATKLFYLHFHWTKYQNVPAQGARGFTILRLQVHNSVNLVNFESLNAGYLRNSKN